jgi:hypothetical protein
MSFVIGQGCEAVCYGRCAAYQRYKWTYCLKCSVVMEAAYSSDTSILLSQISPFQTSEHRSLKATVWKPQISKVARMFQYTRISTQTHKNSFWIGFWGHLKIICHTLAILSRKMLTRSNFLILIFVFFDVYLRMLYLSGKYNLLSYGTALGYLRLYFLAACRFLVPKFLSEENTLMLANILWYLFSP